MTTPLTGSVHPVSLGGGYALRAPGLSGHAEVVQAFGGAQRGASMRALDASMSALDEALANAGVVHVRDIIVEARLQPRPAVASAPLRGAGGQPMLELEVPDAGPRYGQVVLSVDDAGAMRWHFAQPDAAGARASRGQGSGKRFRVPATWGAAPPLASDTHRSLLGAVARRVLKVFVYPLSDALVGGLGQLFCKQWEATHRPYRLRRFTPDNHAQADADLPDQAAIAAMAAHGPMLLFVHGTFSTAHGAFGDLPVPTMAALSTRYDGRVLAFDHPTLADDPLTNTRWLLSCLPQVPMVFDIVSHSRGGLVSRCLAGHAASLGLLPEHVRVRRLLMAGVPNAGTLLADPDHMVDLVDRMTTMLTMLPGAAAVETLEAIVTVVKVLAHGLLSGLDGLSCMHPRSAFLAGLNTATSASPVECFSVAADYETDDRGLRALVSSMADGLADQVFGDAANDLIVPTGSVHGANGHPDFPIPEARTLLFGPHDGVMHTRLFGQPALSERLLQWMAAQDEAPAARLLAPAS